MSTRGKRRRWEMLLILLFTVPGSRSERNVALEGTAKQSADQDYRWTVVKGIDNCTNQHIGYLDNCCSHTQVSGHMQAWWRVDLGKKITIQTVTIYYREHSGFRFGGYSLYVSNVTNQGVLCYQDTSQSSDDVDLNPTHLCPYVGRYVTVYNQREDPKRYEWYSEYAVLELCEVQVYGCPVGSYGNHNCNNRCPESCYGGNCNAKTGSCFSCVAGKHGDVCDLDCSDGCTDRLCRKDTGYCLECVPEKYGNDCAMDYSDNCKDKNCTTSNGHCIECVPGKYGNDCAMDCSDNCKDTHCTTSNGHCIECVIGKYGECVT